MQKSPIDHQARFHDIAQPLNVIRLSCSNIRASPFNDVENDKAYLDKKILRIEEQVDRLSALLDDLRSSLND